jgi:uncharacterized protein (DUF1697 family)
MNVISTTRNWNTVNKLLEMFKGSWQIPSLLI